MDHKPFYKALGIMKRIEDKMGDDGIINLIKHHLKSCIVTPAYVDNLLAAPSRAMRELKSMINLVKGIQCHYDGWGWVCSGEHSKNHTTTKKEIQLWRQSVIPLIKGDRYTYRESNYWKCGGEYKADGWMSIDEYYFY